jgi:hypothetical protein
VLIRRHSREKRTLAQAWGGVYPILFLRKSVRIGIAFIGIWPKARARRQEVTPLFNIARMYHLCYSNSE